MKADVAVRRLERLEKELPAGGRRARSQPTRLPRTGPKSRSSSSTSGSPTRSLGFCNVPTGEIVFTHASAVRGAEVLTIGTDAWVRVVHDGARAQGRRKGIEHAKPGTHRVRQGEASRVAQQVRRAAALTAELAAQWRRKSPKCAGSLSVVNSSSLPTGQGPLQRRHAHSVIRKSRRRESHGRRSGGPLRQGHRQRRGPDARESRKHEAGRSAAKSRRIASTRRGNPTPPRQEGRGVGEPVSEAAEIGAESKRGVRAGVQAESDNRAQVLTFRFL